MNRKYILLSFIWVVPILCMSQRLSIQGKVWDEKTGKPLAYANVFLKRTAKGVITNREGGFSIKLKPSDLPDSLIVSYLGYETYKVPVVQAGGLEIPLEPSDYALDEVLIMPDSTLRVLLRKAYNRIEQNYPQSPTMLSGFYRENMLTEDDDYVYLSESVFDFYKTEYSARYRNDEGQIRLKKVRNFLSPKADSANNLFFINGPFMVNQFDYVKKRAKFIHPKYFSKYTYALTGYNWYLDHKVYEISFSPKRDTATQSSSRVGGLLYISVDSLAYVGIDYFRKSLKEEEQEAESSFLTSDRYETTSNTIQVRYQSDEEIWQLKSIVFSGEGINRSLRTRLHFEDLYVCTQVATENVKPIPYQERFGYSEVISSIMDTLEGNFFEEYTTLSRDSLFDKRSSKLFDSKRVEATFNRVDNQLLIARQQASRLQKRLKALNVLRKFSAMYQLGVLPLEVDFQSLRLFLRSGNSTLSAQIRPPSAVNLPIVGSQIQYKFSSRLGLFYSVLFDVHPDIFFSTREIGLFTEVLVKRKGKPLLFIPDIRIAFASLGVQSAEVESPVAFELSGKTFDSESIDFRVGSSRTMLLPGLRFQYKLNRFLWLHAQANYIWELEENRQAWVRERQGFAWFRRNAKIALPSETLELTYQGDNDDTNRISLQNLQLRVGLGMGF